VDPLHSWAFGSCIQCGEEPIFRVGIEISETEVPTLLRGKDVQEIEELKLQGLSIKAISKLTGCDRKTIRKYLAQPEGVPVYGPRESRASKLDTFKTYIEERLKAGVWNARVLLQEWAKHAKPCGAVPKAIRPCPAAQAAMIGSAARRIIVKCGWPEIADLALFRSQ
jgi:hypothetical protein